MSSMKKSQRVFLLAAKIAMYIALTGLSGCLSYSHYKYSKRADAARVLPEGVSPRPGRIYFASFPENCLGEPVLGWRPNIGHASLVTRDNARLVKKYDYGWFCGRKDDWPADAPSDAIEYKGDYPSYGLVRRKVFPTERSSKATNDMEVARMVLEGLSGYGNKVELWAKDVDDVGIAERYMELSLAHVGEFGSQGRWAEVLPVDVSPAADLLEILVGEPVGAGYERAKSLLSDLAEGVV